MAALQRSVRWERETNQEIFIARGAKVRPQHQDNKLVTTILRKRNEEAIVDSSLSANTVATDTDLRAA
ncbi:Hypothetical predicted protein [Lynx pardinus]|uniref:Uncharacterized protein n=1 Tax=Lynx pardinus TaxID=191816 RepID=A0A485NR36_LYNPA|nr:Hypothetical predicted protein [Lynx pardinus]